MNDTLINVIGWIGSILLIVAYYMNSKNILTAQSSSYQAMNIIGSILLIVNTIYYKAYPSSAVNLVWVFIGLYYLTKNKNYEK